MLFDSLFKSDKRIAVGRSKKRRLTVREVVRRLDRLELTAANCTLIRDRLGNEKVEDYGQVDVFRVRDEAVFLLDNGFCITTPSGMKLKSGVGNVRLASMISHSDTFHEEEEVQPLDDLEDAGEEEQVEAMDAPSESSENPESSEGPEEPAEEEAEQKGDRAEGRRRRPAVRDAFSDPEQRRQDESEEGDVTLGLGEVIRLRFFHRRIPYEIDCQIVDRFHPLRYRAEDLTPRFGVGYHVRPLTDVRKRDLRRHVRYTHRVGFGHLRIRNEIQFHAHALRTDIEVPEKGALASVLLSEDFQVFPYGIREVPEVRNAEKLEDLVEFFMACMASNSTDKRLVYVSKPYLDKQNRASLVGLGLHTIVGVQQATILPKIFIKKPAKGKSVAEKMLQRKESGPRGARRLRMIEDVMDRYQLYTRELKIWHQRRWRKTLVGEAENDRVIIGFISAHGLNVGDIYPNRHMEMPCEVTDIGVENITLKPVPYVDYYAQEQEKKEFIRQEDGFPIELLNFSVGGAQIRGGDTQEKNEAFLRYLVGEKYDRLSLVERLEQLQRSALVLHFCPMMNFVRSEIQAYEPYLPFKIPVIARVARFRITQDKEDEEPRISSLGVEFMYNPALDSFSRDVCYYDRWEQITPFTENPHFLDVHKSLQLLFGFDRALEEVLRETDRRTGRENTEDSERRGGP